MLSNLATRTGFPPATPSNRNDRSDPRLKGAR